MSLTTTLKSLTGSAAMAALMAGGATTAMADTLNVQLSSDIRSSQPGINRDAITDSVMLNVVEGLVAAGEGGDIQPMLAESWTVSDDRTTYTFILRDDVVFHNGAKLTAEDVKFSWEKLLNNPDYNCNVFFDGSRGTEIVDINIVDPQTVAFELNTADEMLLTYMAQPQCGAAAITHRDSFNEDGSWNKPIGTGPFVFDEWVRGESIRLVKFDDYAAIGTKVDGYGGRKEVLVDDVKLVVVPDNSAAVAGLRSGDLDILPYVPPSEAAELEGDDQFLLVSEPHGGLVTILFQTQDPVMGHPAMRKAFATALDVPQVVEAVTYGLGVPNNSLVATGSLYHTDHHDKGYNYDPSAVPVLLEEAGYQGEEITLLTNRRSAISYDVAVIGQAMLQAAGINVKIEVLEWASQLDRFRSGKYQAMAFNYSNRADPALAYNAVTASKEARANAIWDNPEAIELLKQVLQEPDQAERQKIFDKMHTMFLEDVPLLMLANGLDVGVSAKHVTGYRTWHGFARLWGVGLNK